MSVLEARLFSGEKKSSVSGKVTPIRGKEVPFGSDTSADVIFRFLRSKLSPVFGFGFNVVSGENVVGEEVEPLTEAASMFVPLSFRDIRDSMVEHGAAPSAALTMLSLLGMGIQTFGPDMKNEADLGKALRRVSGPSAGPEGFEALRGVSEERAVRALRAHMKGRGARVTGKAFRARVRKLREGLSKVQ